MLIGDDPTRFHTRAIDLAVHAVDASHYRLVPEAVVVAQNSDEVAELMRQANSSGRTITFRAGGTSLAGQAVGTGMIVDVRRNFRGIEVLDDASRVRVQPGITVRQVNAHLARHGRRLGPDPASEAACTMGGVIANNSSGMECGIRDNTYQTLESMTYVLPSGTTINTAHRDAGQQLRHQEPGIHAGIAALRDRIRGNPRSVALIRKHFALKNTMGYGVNAFLDHNDPAEILARLIVGSEGTLAFVAEAVFKTLPIPANTLSALTVLPTLEHATALLPDLVATGAATVELMDATSLRVGQSLPGTPAQIHGFDATTQAALLVEYKGDDPEALEKLARSGAATLGHAAVFTSSVRERQAMWSFRKGLYASVAGNRPPGTMALLEDIAVPVAALADVCHQLQGLFDEHGYVDSVIFGHAKDGNIHFMLTDRFHEGPALRRLEHFTDSMVDVVLAAGGNLKAEHGTGRAMAPYVERQYGPELHAVMRELKNLCDPRGILNPGVIITDGSTVHATDFKAHAPVEDEVDRCVECGYCEPVCPSQDLTLTPRQRITARRAQAAAERDGHAELAEQLRKEQVYDSVQTCAVDSMCQTACPLGINTGNLVKRLRSEQVNQAQSTAWNAAARHWGQVTRLGAAALTVADKLPAKLVSGVTDVGRAVVGHDTLPRYSSDIPRGGPRRGRLAGLVGGGDGQPLALFIPACVNSMFGSESGPGVSEAFVELLKRADVRVLVPDGVERLCCSTPWSSKGLGKGRATMVELVRAELAALGVEGGLPVISDATSCTQGFGGILADEGWHVEDATTFTVRELLPRLTVQRRVGSVVLHPTCSSFQLGIDQDIQVIAEAVADEVSTPVDWRCCGFAGDRGMLHPELTKAATAAEAREVRELRAEYHVSANRTCELGLSRATGQSYRHILQVLEEVSIFRA